MFLSFLFCRWVMTRVDVWFVDVVFLRFRCCMFWVFTFVVIFSWCWSWCVHQQTLQSCGPATQWKTGRTTKMGKKWENRGKFAPIENGETWPKNTKKMGNRANFPFFSVFFGHFFPISDRGKFSRFSHFFPFFVVRPVFHCVAGPQNKPPKKELAGDPRRAKKGGLAGGPPMSPQAFWILLQSYKWAPIRLKYWKI